MDAHSTARVAALAEALGAGADDVSVCRRSLPVVWDETRDWLMISLPSGLWSGWERIDGAGGPKRLMGRLRPWRAVPPLIAETATLFSSELDRTLTEIRMEVPALGEGEIGLLAHYAETGAAPGDAEVLSFIRSCLHRRGSAV
ncbi:hypothetical protein [Microbacterium sp. BK668]|uniref:hypothetical protein n=1 Tax=Microbacterium sp. BK668 TaxID=2512118 RepID=UPI00105F0967|nr:hypothetical protein [Microbacterium sp. BK668]TDN88428.1 hypothetical protein EV279_2870 [Microbacterium sp. BK668]